MAAKVEREGGTPVTRDLLGVSKVLGRDLMTKNMLFCGPATGTPKQSNRPLEDLNCPPINFKPPSPPNLELNLFPLYTSENHSVCTLDKVKSALERARRTSKRPNHNKLEGSTSPTSTSTTTKVWSEEESESRSSVEDESLVVKPAFAAAGCPGCLSYVLVSNDNPSCPRCLTVVPSPVLKKARIQLELHLNSTSN